MCMSGGWVEVLSGGADGSLANVIASSRDKLVSLVCLHKLQIDVPIDTLFYQKPCIMNIAQNIKHQLIFIINHLIATFLYIHDISVFRKNTIYFFLKLKTDFLLISEQSNNWISKDNFLFK